MQQNQLPHLLSEAAWTAVLKAQREGLGTCARCRWAHGCRACDGVKALRYWLRKEGWGTIAESIPD